MKWDLALLCLLLESKLALLYFDNALKLKESVLFRSLVLSQIPSKSCPT